VRLLGFSKLTAGYNTVKYVNKRAQEAALLTTNMITECWNIYLLLNTLHIL